MKGCSVSSSVSDPPTSLDIKEETQRLSTMSSLYRNDLDGDIEDEQVRRPFKRWRNLNHYPYSALDSIKGQQPDTYVSAASI